jgi:YbgC/YbaW family acyl-CoA thioester hydrolase
VYHANYLRYMERGRTNHLRLMGAEQHALLADAQAETPGFAFVVRSIQIDYLKPARMDDVLDVVTWPVAVKGACARPTMCWSRPWCASLSLARARRSRSRGRSGCC